MNDHLKVVVDWLAVSVAAITLAGWLNIVLAVPAAIWTSIRIYEYLKSK